MKMKVIAARLRPDRDCDIIVALSRLDSGQVSKVIRKGLRMVLGSSEEGIKQDSVVKATESTNAAEENRKLITWKGF